MALRIITADERLAAANNKTSIALFGPAGSGKTSQLKTLPPEQTLCLDLEAGLKSVQDCPGRVGYWDVGVPPSGPMDELALRAANRLVVNPSP